MKRWWRPAHLRQVAVVGAQVKVCLGATAPKSVHLPVQRGWTSLLAFLLFCIDVLPPSVLELMAFAASVSVLAGLPSPQGDAGLTHDAGGVGNGVAIGLSAISSVSRGGDERCNARIFLTRREKNG